MFLPSSHRDLTAYFNALANPTRLRILERLAESGEESVNSLALDLRMSQPRISWHLRLLRLGGLVRTRRDGRQVYCSVDPDAIGRRHLELSRLLGLQQNALRAAGQAAGPVAGEEVKS